MSCSQILCIVLNGRSCATEVVRTRRSDFGGIRLWRNSTYCACTTLTPLYPPLPPSTLIHRTTYVPHPDGHRVSMSPFLLQPLIHVLSKPFSWHPNHNRCHLWFVEFHSGASNSFIQNFCWCDRCISTKAIVGIEKLFNHECASFFFGAQIWARTGSLVYIFLWIVYL